MFTSLDKLNYRMDNAENSHCKREHGKKAEHGSDVATNEQNKLIYICINYRLNVLKLSIYVTEYAAYRR